MNGNGIGHIEQLIDRKGSVTKGDYTFPYNGARSISFMVYPSVLMSHLPDVGTLANMDYRTRDAILARTPAMESFWGSAIAIAIAKVATRGFEVESDVPLQRKRAQEILNYAVAGISVGWKKFVPYHLGGYLNQSFVAVEIIRESKYPGARVTGIAHLPPRQCQLTGNPEYPLEYVDANGDLHRMAWWQVLIFSDLPDPNEVGGGMGICAAQRAYPHIRKLAALEEYVTSKITGDRPQAIYITNAMNERQLEEGLNSGKDDAERKGRNFSVQHKGALILPSPKNEDSFLLTIPLAELPDGFDVQVEFNRGILAYADAIGIDVQDLQPLTGAALGTGAQSRILDEKGDGKGLNLWADQFMEGMNLFVLSSQTTVSWYSRDLRDEKQKVDIQKVRAETQDILIKAAITTTEQSRNVLIDEGDLPEEYRATDLTQTGMLADDEKPELADAQQEDAEQTEANQLPIPVEQPIAQKAINTDLDALYQEELARARGVAKVGK